ncbi:MAG: 4Fe-4S cluster-binding domain-containing protein [Bacteroidales bacterium]|nr:4Fe-4S cluster-binding domain-containing protein [Bacteroidales bacterium]
MYPYSKHEAALLTDCTLCPRLCKVNRFSSKLGFCKTGSEPEISSICCHKGEEPVISGKNGICNVFFSRCNLQCNFCQNFEISRNTNRIIEKNLSFKEIIYQICSILEYTENIVGFVSPSHQVPQMLAIIRELHKENRHPVFVYNTNAYDRVETLKTLEGIIDVYLPDYKYSDPTIADEYSQAFNYPEIALKAIKEMYRQKGPSLLLNDRKIAESGIIIRHLVLPNQVKQSIQVLKTIAEDISPDLNISLMSQYYPTTRVSDHPKLNRTVTPEEFNQVVEAFHELGFYRGWIQELESNLIFRPDFNKEQPFDDKS